MGIEYYVICRKCNVRRHLDKNWAVLFGKKVADRQSALEFREQVEYDSFRCGLLISFMAKHMGHDCFLTNDMDDEIFDIPHEAIDFWSTSAEGREAFQEQRMME